MSILVDNEDDDDDDSNFYGDDDHLIYDNGDVQWTHPCNYPQLQASDSALKASIFLSTPNATKHFFLFIFPT